MIITKPGNRFSLSFTTIAPNDIDFKLLADMIEEVSEFALTSYGANNVVTLRYLEDEGEQVETELAKLQQFCGDRYFCFQLDMLNSDGVQREAFIFTDCSLDHVTIGPLNYDHPNQLKTAAVIRYGTAYRKKLNQS